MAIKCPRCVVGNLEGDYSSAVCNSCGYSEIQGEATISLTDESKDTPQTREFDQRLRDRRSARAENEDRSAF